MTWPGQENHVEVVFRDQPIQMNINQARTRVRTPVTEQTDLRVFDRQGLSQKRIVSQKDHSKTEVETCSPISIHLAKFFNREGRALNSRSGFSECAEVGGWSMDVVTIVVFRVEVGCLEEKEIQRKATVNLLAWGSSSLPVHP
jgi:hypothetical protein